MVTRFSNLKLLFFTKASICIRECIEDFVNNDGALQVLESLEECPAS